MYDCISGHGAVTNLPLSGFRLLQRGIFDTAREPLNTHHHPAMEITFLYSGRQCFYVDQKEYQLQGMDLFVAYPREEHSSNGHPQNRARFFNLEIDPVSDPAHFLGLEDPGLPAFCQQLASLPRTFHGSRRLLTLMNDFFTLWHGCRQLKTLLLQHKLLEILLEILDCAGKSAEAVTPDIQAAMNKLKVLITENPTIDQLAAAAHLSVSHFTAKFHAQTGMPPADYIMQQRLNEAKKLLLAGRSIIETAYALNFSSSQYFSTCFRKYLNMTPRQFCLKYQDERKRTMQLILNPDTSVLSVDECKLLNLDELEVCYTLPEEDITQGQKPYMLPYIDHRAQLERSGERYTEPETGSVLSLETLSYGLVLTLHTDRKDFSEYGLSLPLNFMGKGKSGGWRKQYLLNNVYRSTDGSFMYAYLTNPNGRNVCITALNPLDGWRADYSTFNCGHLFQKLNFYAHFDKAYGTPERENTLRLLIMPVENYSDCLDKLAMAHDQCFLDLKRSGGKIGDKIKLIPHGLLPNYLKLVNAGGEKTIPWTEELTIECEGDTQVFPMRAFNNVAEYYAGGEAEFYGYKSITDLYRKTMQQVDLYRAFHFADGHMDGNVCEHQCWMSAALRFLQKYKDEMCPDEVKKLEKKLKYVLDIITEPDPAKAVHRITILSTPHKIFPAYNIFGHDRVQEEDFAITILLDAYKYFGEQKYYDYAVNTMDSMLSFYQKEDGSIRLVSGSDYSTVTCLIIPIIDLSLFLKEKDPERSKRYREAAQHLAQFICDRGLDFPTEGGGTEDPDEKEMEDGSISCSALSLLYYCDHIEMNKKFLKVAKQILDVHETWHICSSTCGSKGSSLRWWETCWEGDQNGAAICAGHGWTIWRAEADWLYYKLTGDKAYYTKAFNGFMTNFSKIRKDGKSFAIRNIDMIPGGGFHKDSSEVTFKLQGKFPYTNDSGLSRYVWIRACDSFIDTLIKQEYGDE